MSNFVCISVEHGIHPHITQICVMDLHNSTNKFTTYVLPKTPITEDAERVTGISVNGNEMLYKGNPVEFLSWCTAGARLIDWNSNYSKN